MLSSIFGGRGSLKWSHWAIGDIEQIEKDFANKHVGFGTSVTQEELILGTSPETCVIVFFNEVLETNKAVLITGAKRYEDYSGYGQHARFVVASSQSFVKLGLGFKHLRSVYKYIFPRT